MEKNRKNLSLDYFAIMEIRPTTIITNIANHNSQIVNTGNNMRRIRKIIPIAISDPPLI